MSENQINTMQNRMNVVPQYDEAIVSLQGRRDLITSLMGKVLVEGTHYGKIPGCGDKPSLFLPGAEQLAATFGFAPKYKIEKTREGQHLIADVTCDLYLPDGTFVGSGVAICSTYESKYRYRGGAGEPTGEPVPKKYWDLKKTDFKAAQAAIGGPGFTAKKIDGAWMICVMVEKQENPDLADQWNTVIKMGAKRALVHSVRTATGTADVFTQDIEDFRDSYGSVIDAEVVMPEPQPRPTTHAEPTSPPAQTSAKNGWGVEEEGAFSSLIGTDLYTIFRDGGHPEMFQKEADLWRERKKTGTATEVLGGLRTRINTLRDAAEKAKAKAASPAPSAAPILMDEPPPSDDPGPEYMDAEVVTNVPQPGSPEYAKAASDALNAACGRFVDAYTKAGIVDPGSETKKMRNEILKGIKFKGNEHQDEKKMLLASAMQTEADRLLIP